MLFMVSIPDVLLGIPTFDLRNSMTCTCRTQSQIILIRIYMDACSSSYMYTVQYLSVTSFLTYMYIYDFVLPAG